MLELKYLRSDLLEKANAIDAELKSTSGYDKPIERAQRIGQLSGLLDAIALIDESLKHIEISNNINELL